MPIFNMVYGGGGGGGGGLPSEYQEVEWISSSGSQYILTNINPGPTYSLTSKISLNVTTGDRGLFVAQNSSGKRWGVTITSSKWQVTGPCVQENNPNYGSVSANTIYNIDYCYTTQTSFIVNSSNVRTGMPVGSAAVGVNLAIFAFNNNGSIIYQSSMTLYNLKIYNSGTLIADYVPCYRKSDSVIGLYDVVGGTFYTNAGTGTFTKGADVN